MTIHRVRRKRCVSDVYKGERKERNKGSRSKGRGGQTAVKVHQQKKGRRGKKMMDCERHDEGRKRHRRE